MGKTRDEIAAIVREAREIRCEDQISFAKSVRASRRSITRWESGDAVPRLDALARILLAMREFEPARARQLAAELEIERVVPPPDPPPKAAPMPPDRACERALLLACAAADMTPRRTRAAIVAALAELRAAELSIEQAYAMFTADPALRE